MPAETGERHAMLEEAFRKDGFTIIKKAFTVSGSIGIEARHNTAVDYGTRLNKKSYYIEGTPYERGFLLGLLAEPEIADMAEYFAADIVPDYFAPGLLSNSPAVQSFMAYAVNELARKTWYAQPKHVRDEASGIVSGCSMANRSTRVSEERLMAVNAGADALCALIYSGRIRDIIPQLSPDLIRLPMMGSAFSAFGRAAPGEHFFGRDLKSVPGNVFKKHLAHIITLPACGEEKAYPFVSVTAPGLLGGVSIMNSEGVAGGINMSPAANCSTDNLGFYSSLLLRESIMFGGSTEQAAGIIQSAKRGVPWNYVISDGRSDTACTVEAGISGDDIDLLSYPAKDLLKFLPDRDFLKLNDPAPVKNGCAVRWCGAPFPDSYLSFNSGLWGHYNGSGDKGSSGKEPGDNSPRAPKAELYDDAFSQGGYINRTWDERNCPGCLYFAPRRTGKDIHITTNSFLLPQMRLCAMQPWIDSIVRAYINDIQWRYDELSNRIKQGAEDGGIDYEYAKRITDFIAPNKMFPQIPGKSRFVGEPRIEGCTTIFDLKKITAESRYGCCRDEWVKTTLPEYFKAGEAALP